MANQLETQTPSTAERGKTGFRLAPMIGTGGEGRELRLLGERDICGADFANRDL
jgi:hypothetical protein